MDTDTDGLPFHLTLRAGQEEFQLEGVVPAGSVELADFLPMLQGLDDILVGAAVREMESAGKPISCGPGCGVCCSQLVPVSEAEATQIARLVERMSDTQREQVRARFDSALDRLDASRMTQRLLELNDVTSIDVFHGVSMDYLSLRIPCPFLESDSCSIHPDRPLICREYIVTSSPEYCLNPTAETIDRVGVPNKLSSFMLTFGQGGPMVEEVRWMPLVSALRWAEVNARRPMYPAPFLMEKLVVHLAGPENNMGAADSGAEGRQSPAAEADGEASGGRLRPNGRILKSGRGSGETGTRAGKHLKS